MEHDLSFANAWEKRKLVENGSFSLDMALNTFLFFKSWYLIQLPSFMLYLSTCDLREVTRVTYAGFQTWVNTFAGNGARAFILPPKHFNRPSESNDKHIDYAKSSRDVDLALGQTVFIIWHSIVILYIIRFAVMWGIEWRLKQVSNLAQSDTRAKQSSFNKKYHVTFFHDLNIALSKKVNDIV